MVALNEEPNDGYGSVTDYNAGHGKLSEQKPLRGGADDAAKKATITRGNSLLLDWEEKELLQDEVSCMTKLAIPVVCTYLLETLPGIVTIVLVGRIESQEEISSGEEGGLSLQKLHLDAAALAVMFMNVVAISPAFGILTAMDTLCSQAHGANRPQKMGTYLLTGLAVVSVMLVSGSILIWHASSILIVLGQPAEVSRMTGEFVRYMLPGVPFLCLYEILRKVFQARNEVLPMLVAAAVCNVVNVALGYYLVHFSEFGWIGAAMARTAGSVSMIPTVLIGMIASGGAGKKDGSADLDQDGNTCETQQCLRVDSGHANTANEDKDDANHFLHHLWEGFVISEALSAEAILGFLSIGFPGMLQVMFEWVAFEVIFLLCGILPHGEAIIGLGANAVIANVSQITYMLFLGASVSGSVRVGNALGAGDVHRAEVASNLTLHMGVILAVVNMTFLLTCRHRLPWLFTTDPDVVEEARRLFLVAAVFQLPDAGNACVQGIFRGSGRMATGATWNFVAYYIVGLPLGAFLGLRLGLGVEGLWWGMTAGLCVICIGCLSIVSRSDWKQLSIDTKTRLEN